MIRCLLCGKKPAAASITICADCVRGFQDRKKLYMLHHPFRRKYRLPLEIPRSERGISCRLCVNRCSMGQGSTGYCGLRTNQGGYIQERMEEGSALLHAYQDMLPTNCCASWFCRGSHEKGYNLAVFFYGCNFDCLFCQNASHKLLDSAPSMTEEELVRKALEEKVRCVCFFGGSPEPQLPFALRVAQRVHVESGGKKHICWEWNGAGRPDLVRKAVDISIQSGGTVKFDLKAFNPNLHAALCGVDRNQTYRNFTLAAEMCREYENVLNATTLLVSHYVDSQEIRKIAAFIADLDSRIPYSLLVFHPDFCLEDLPVTPREQVFECYDEANLLLERVHIGNRELL